MRIRIRIRSTANSKDKDKLCLANGKTPTKIEIVFFIILTEKINNLTIFSGITGTKSFDLIFKFNWLKIISQQQAHPAYPHPSQHHHRESTGIYRRFMNLSPVWTISCSLLGGANIQVDSCCQIFRQSMVIMLHSTWSLSSFLL